MPLLEADCPRTGDVPHDEALGRLQEALPELNNFENAVLYLKHTEGLRCPADRRTVEQALGDHYGNAVAGLREVAIEARRARRGA